jgi:hypothetical protein
MALPVKTVAARSAWLFLWTTGSHLPLPAIEAACRRSRRSPARSGDGAITVGIEVKIAVAPSHWTGFA